MVAPSSSPDSIAAQVTLWSWIDIRLAPLRPSGLGLIRSVDVERPASGSTDRPPAPGAPDTSGHRTHPLISLLSMSMQSVMEVLLMGSLVCSVGHAIAATGLRRLTAWGADLRKRKKVSMLTNALTCGNANV